MNSKQIFDTVLKNGICRLPCGSFLFTANCIEALRYKWPVFEDDPTLPIFQRWKLWVLTGTPAKLVPLKGKCKLNALELEDRLNRVEIAVDRFIKHK